MFRTIIAARHSNQNQLSKNYSFCDMVYEYLPIHNSDDKILRIMI